MEISPESWDTSTLKTRMKKIHQHRFCPLQKETSRGPSGQMKMQKISNKPEGQD